MIPTTRVEEIALAIAKEWDGCEITPMVMGIDPLAELTSEIANGIKKALQEAIQQGSAVTPEQRALLADIFGNTERLDKITIKLDPVTRDVTIRYEDLDDEWFRELLEAARK